MKLFSWSLVLQTYSSWWCFLELRMNQLLNVTIVILRKPPSVIWTNAHCFQRNISIPVSALSASARASISLVCPHHIWHDSPENRNNNSLLMWSRSSILGDSCNFMIYQVSVVFSLRSYKLGITSVYFGTYKKLSQKRKKKSSMKDQKSKK